MTVAVDYEITVKLNKILAVYSFNAISYHIFIRFLFQTDECIYVL